jgi:cytidylate kinase
MVILIAGSTHTGKTLLAQKLLEEYKYPYLSIDHLKMGLIRSKQCDLHVDSGCAELTNYLWPIIKEIIKTCIENSQNLIIEGCYIPFGWDKDFKPEYLKQIKYTCLIFSKNYIKNNLHEIKKHENAIEQRLQEEINEKELQKENEYNLGMCRTYNYNYILIDEAYSPNIKHFISTVLKENK